MSGITKGDEPSRAIFSELANQLFAMIPILITAMIILLFLWIAVIIVQLIYHMLFVKEQYDPGELNQLPEERK